MKQSSIRTWSAGSILNSFRSIMKVASSYRLSLLFHFSSPVVQGGTSLGKRTVLKRDVSSKCLRVDPKILHAHGIVNDIYQNLYINKMLSTQWTFISTLLTENLIWFCIFQAAQQVTIVVLGGGGGIYWQD